MAFRLAAHALLDHAPAIASTALVARFLAFFNTLLGRVTHVVILDVTHVVNLSVHLSLDLHTQLHAMSDRALSEFRNHSVGFVFQAFHLLDHLNCRENVALPALFAGDGGPAQAERRERAETLLERVGLGGLGERYPTKLSGGERQRVAIARALFCGPRLLIADEPTGNLDVRTGNAILDMFSELNERDGLTLVVVTHDPLVAERAGRVITLDGRRIVEDAAA